MIRKAKSEYFLDKKKKSANASKFWKNIKFLTSNRSVSALPNCITKDGIKIVDKLQMLNCFNSHFTESGSLFQTNNYTTVNSEFLNAERHLWTTEFVFNHITTSDVCSALQNLDVNKSSGPDLIEPLFLKLAANIISQPLSYLFNLSLTTKEIPQIWKSAFVVPLLKGGVPTLLVNYRPISKLCILSKLLEHFVMNLVPTHSNCTSPMDYISHHALHSHIPVHHYNNHTAVTIHSSTLIASPHLHLILSLT